MSNDRSEAQLQGRLTSAALMVIVGVGTLLRAWENRAGLPDGYLHDEIFEVHRALQLLRGDYDFWRLKGCYFLLLSIVYLFHGGVQVVLGQCESLSAYVAASVVQPGSVILLSRYVTLALSVASMLGMFVVARRTLPERPWRPDLMATCLWAICPIAIWLGHWGLVETCFVTFAILSLIPILNITDGGGMRDYIAAGSLIALASATKRYGIVLALPLLLAHLNVVRLRHLASWRRALTDHRLIMAVVTLGLVVIVVNPAWVNYLLNKANVVSSPVVPDEIDVPKSHHVRYYFNTVRWNVGTLLFLFSPIGLLVALKRRAAQAVVVMVFSIVFLGLLMSWKANHLVGGRYTMVTLPGLIIASVYGVSTIFDFLAARLSGVLRTSLVPATAAFVLGNGVYNTVTSHAQYSVCSGDRVPVRTAARRWFDSEVPAGAKVVLMGQRVWPQHQTISIHDLAENYRRRHDAPMRKGIYLKNMSALLDFAKAEGLTRYDLTLVDRHDVWESLPDYIDDGARYFVVDVLKFEPECNDRRSIERRSIAGKHSRIALYNELKSSPSVELLKRFEGADFMGPRTIVEVYGVVDADPLRPLLGVATGRPESASVTAETTKIVVQ